ncbi:MarR family winged helix-turn-helix transcriptional regulator [Ideonella livida]|uniref:Winged helix-turn-helix transcriptional regulator n=1 Tax=Ideonella livida TaxID=2707176 RepID=A0A7C9PHL5_9BURK|nr:MarR family winged helix-turn-helix transcriptional regulator [Ideonella livida]NDY91254.1 winged helix-turn-helix transcriptional regulator [Ideonella livida]
MPRDPKPAPVAAAGAPSPVDLLTHRLHVLSKLTDRLSDARCQAEVGLPLGEARCLAVVGSMQPLSVNQLAQQVSLDKAQASRAAQSLSDQGLLRKLPAAHDARGVELKLTTRGRYRWRKLMAVIEQGNEQLFSVLPPDDRDRLAQALEQLIQHARRQCAEAAMLAGR